LDGESTLLRARDQGPSCLRRLERRPHVVAPSSGLAVTAVPAQRRSRTWVAARSR